jgi:hypothetical protein
VDAPRRPGTGRAEGEGGQRPLVDLRTGFLPFCRPGAAPAAAEGPGPKRPRLTRTGRAGPAVPDAHRAVA